MSLIRRTPRVSQPQGAVQIDGSNPLTQGTAFLWSASAPRREIKTGEIASALGGTLDVGVPGKIFQSYSATIGVEWPREFVTTSDGAGTGDFTLVTYANPRAVAVSGASEHMLAQKNDAGGTPFAQASILAHSDAAFNIASGSLAFCIFNGSTVGVTAAGQLDGEWHVFVAARRGTTMLLARDGRVVATATVASLSILQATPQRYFAVGSRGNGNTNSFADRTAFAWGLNRALSDDEIAKLGKNPWQLFAPEPRRLFVPAAVGGATTITCTVGAASAAGVSSLVNTALQTGVGAAGAVGVTASVNRTLQTSVAASSATGVTALVSRTLQTSVGAAAATGVTALLPITLAAGTGNASAVGVNAVINTAGNATIACSVGAASAVGVAALANTTLQTTVGAASGQGVLARLNVTLQTGVGAASAVGVSFSSGGVIYIPALLQFTSPSRAQTFTSPSRLQSFTSPARSGP